jgi:CheY-like chemotaxis protein
MDEIKKIRVLVVEDNFMNKVLVNELLTMHGYEVFEAGNGVEAVEMTESLVPDIVLMDINLPEMDGMEATHIIKSKEALKDIPILALTASAMKGDEEKFLKKGFDGYVPKPISLEVLIKELDRCLGK